jgi:hypothetical protein
MAKEICADEVIAEILTAIKERHSSYQTFRSPSSRAELG